MNYKDTYVIVLNGPPRSGKDTLGDFLLNTYKGSIMSLRFSQVLKDGAHRLLGLNCHTEAYNDYKDANHEDFFGMKPRDFYIQLSEQFMKTRFGSDVFGHLWVREYTRLMEVYEEAMSIGKSANQHTTLQPPVCVVTDCGFEEELKPLINYFGKDRINLIQIHRHDYDFSNDSRSYLDGGSLGLNTGHIVNPEGDIDQYFKNAMAALEAQGILAQL